MDPLVVFSPAKLNLFLAVTGRRADGFHDLLSLAVPLEFGDQLEIRAAPAGELSLHCDRPGVPLDGSNLILRAARAFAERAAWSGGASFRLEKRIPVGAGLGGGSSNAVAALVGLNQIAGHPLPAEAMAALAAELGSDCALFLHGGPVILRGRGERIAPVPPPIAARLAGQRVLLFKPAFGIDTPWAYRRLAEEAAAAPAERRVYLASAEAEARLAAWMNDPDASLDTLLFNSLERPAFSKYIALPALLAQLQRGHGWTAGMSGSGSACFGFLDEHQPVEPLERAIRAAWGDTALLVATRVVRSPADPS